MGRQGTEPDGFERADEGRFAGQVWFRLGPEAPNGTNVVEVHFSPGARTHWHQHPEGQFILGLAGRGRVRSRGEAAVPIGPGDVVYTPPGQWHFHAADPDAPLVHFAVNNAGMPEWGEPITDEEYDGNA
jgi:quercetin dioxygenase-like cupin family protein